MMQTKNIYWLTALLLCCFSISLFSSCKKNPKGSFTVKGTLIDSCGGSPAANIPIIISHTKLGGVGPRTHDSIGTGITDANGNFEIVCKNWGEGEIRIYLRTVVSAYEFAVLNTTEDNEGKFFDLKTIHSTTSFFASLKVNFTGTFSSSDTFYINNNPYYPIPSSISIYPLSYIAFNPDIKYLEAGHEIEYKNIYWGIGKNNQTNNKSIPYSICGEPEQVTEITVNK